MHTTRMPALWLLSLLTALAPLLAVAADPPGPPVDTAPPDPKLLPGDRFLKPDLQFLKRMNTPSPVKAPPEPGTRAVGPTMQEALTAVQAALAACKSDGYDVASVVIDTDGRPRAGLTADKADGGHLYGSVRKALTALRFQMANSAVTDRLLATPSMLSQIGPDMVAMPGGLPLMRHGRIYGAIGVSGAVSLQDEKCARAGVAAIAKPG